MILMHPMSIAGATLAVLVLVAVIGLCICALVIDDKHRRSLNQMRRDADKKADFHRRQSGQLIRWAEEDAADSEEKMRRQNSI